MNLFDLFIKIGVKDEASDQVAKISEKLGDGLKAAASIGLTAVTTAAAGITALTTAAVKNYAEYEQLVGGVETLFKKSADKVQQYAENAYKTAGLSANEYMSTVTSFSASLLQGLNGDTAQAAKIADKAITDMSDNANKMGTSMEMIQNAYQGFAKQNYTMLDNLKLGYGGTKTEMERLIADANAVKVANGEMADLSIDSFSDVIDAIHIIQTEMGITGTTALEASSTISGSVASMKAAYTNFLTALGDSNADYGAQLDILFESVKTVAGNVLPVAEQALWSIADLVEEVIPELSAKIPQIISEVLPRVTEIAVKLVENLINGISENQEMLFQTVFDVVEFLANSFIGLLPQVVGLGLSLLVSLATGISESLPTLIPTIISVISQIIDTLTNPETLTTLLDASLAILETIALGMMDSLFVLLDAAVSLITALADYILKPENVTKLLEISVKLIKKLSEGLISALPQLVDAAVEIILKLVELLSDPESLEMLISVALELVLAVAQGLIRAVGSLMSAGVELLAGIITGMKNGAKNFATLAGDLIKTLLEKFKEKVDKLKEIGSNIVAGIKEGIKKAWNNLKKWFEGLFDDIIGIAKKILGIQSPSKVFKEIGGFTAEGFGVGFDNAFKSVKKDVEDSLAFKDVSIGISTSVRSKRGILAQGNQGTSVSVVQNIYSQAQTAADLMQEARYEQERAVFLGV